MRSFADQIATGLKDRGHRVQVWTAPECLARLAPAHCALCKWLGYLDQFLLFPPLLWLRAATLPPGSLCVLTDQALGPWIPWLKHCRHVVHVHDLLALEGALGQQPFHSLSWSGRIYQLWIRHGFLGADELFGGYPSHRIVPWLLLLRGLPGGLRHGLLQSIDGRLADKLRRLPRWDRWHLAVAMRRCASERVLAAAGVASLSWPEPPPQRISQRWVRSAGRNCLVTASRCGCATVKP